MKSLFRTAANAFGLLIALPFIAWGKIGLALGSQRPFAGSAAALACWPGYIGAATRRAYYCSMLTRCPWDLGIEFGSMFTKVDVEVGHNVYIGAYCLIGRCRIGDEVLIASRVSLLSGGRQHRFQEQEFRKIEVGTGAWIGEGAVVLNDVGVDCIVGAGSVVVKPAPPGTTVVGNPAHVVRPARTGQGGEESGEGRTRQ